MDEQMQTTPKIESTQNEEDLKLTDSSVAQTPPLASGVGKKSNIPFVLMSILFLAAAGAASYYYFFPLTPAAMTDASATPTPTPIASADPTAGWQTYTDSNITFKYPSNYLLDNSIAPYLNRNITWRFNNTSVLSCKGDCPIIEKKTQVLISDKSATKIEGYIGEVGGNIAQRYVTYEFSGSKYFVITLQALPYVMTKEEVAIHPLGNIYPISEVDLKTFDQILSTFKFVTSQNLTYSFKTFSISYPQSWQATDSNKDSQFFTQNNFTGFDHFVLIQKGAYHLIVGIDSPAKSAEVGGIYLDDQDYQKYLETHTPINIGSDKFLLWNEHTSLEQWNNPTREAGIYALASMSKYTPKKVTNSEGTTYNGYDDYFTKGGNGYMIIVLSDTEAASSVTPTDVQSDITSMLKTIKW